MCYISLHCYIHNFFLQSILSIFNPKPFEIIASPSPFLLMKNEYRPIYHHDTVSDAILIPANSCKKETIPTNTIPFERSFLLVILGLDCSGLLFTQFHLIMCALFFLIAIWKVQRIFLRIFFWPYNYFTSMFVYVLAVYCWFVSFIVCVQLWLINYKKYIYTIKCICV